MQGKTELARVAPELRPLVAEALACLARSGHPWANSMAWVLRTRWIRLARLPRRIRGFTFAVLPWIWLDRGFVELNLPQGGEKRYRIMQTLLHEAAHQLGAIWPEWRNWIGDHNCYGPDRNAADAISEAIMRECYAGQTQYALQPITYVSPLDRLGFTKR